MSVEFLGDTGLGVTDALRLIEERLREAQSVASVGSWEREIAADHIYCSEEVLRIYGLKPVNGRTDRQMLIERIVPEDRQMVDRILMKAAESGGPFEADFRIIHGETGQLRHLHAVGRAETDSNGAVVRLAGCVLDVTDRKLAEIALRASEERFSAFMRNGPHIAAISNSKGQLIYRNETLKAVLENSRDQPLSDWLEQWNSQTREIAVANRPQETFETLSGYGGSTRCFRCIRFPYESSEDRLVGTIGFDVTASKQLEDALRDSEARFRSAFGNAAIGMVLAEMGESRYIQANQAFCSMTGYSETELTGMGFRDITHPDDIAASLEIFGRAAAGQSASWIEKRYVRKDGSLVWVKVSLSPVLDANGIVRHYLGLVEDISEVREARETARRAEERWQLAVHGTTDGIWDWDAATGSVVYSARWKEMLGYQTWELPDTLQVWEELVHPHDLAHAKAALQLHLDQVTPRYEAEYRMRCRDGTFKWIQARGKAVIDFEGKPLRLVGSHADISARKAAEERLLYQAEHDPLTGLANRRLGYRKMLEEVARANGTGEPLCLCVCDLDEFKAVNDMFGHSCGDDVLTAFARILKENVRKRDTSIRMGGDEFVIILPVTTAENAVACMSRVREQLETCAFGTEAGRIFNVTATFGISQFAPGMTAEELLEAADRALYTGKERGRNQVHLLR